MCIKFHSGSTSRYAGLALSMLLTAAVSLPAHATEKWKINTAKSHFSAGANTLVLDRVNSADNAGNAAKGQFLVISGDKVYLAADESAFNASGSVKRVDYNRWKEMKVVQIGEKARSNDVCGFHCQSGHPESHRTVTFTATGGDPSARMSDLIALNSR